MAGNKPRDFRTFLTAWERLDMDAQARYAHQASLTLKQLRAHRKDIDARIAYWEENLDHARKLRRKTESNGRAREREARVIRPKRTRTHKGKFTAIAERAIKHDDQG